MYSNHNILHRCLVRPASPGRLVGAGAILIVFVTFRLLARSFLRGLLDLLDLLVGFLTLNLFV